MMTSIGGSNAQDDLFRQTYLRSLQAAGRRVDAAAYFEAITADKSRTALDGALANLASTTRRPSPYAKSHCLEPVGPLAQSVGHDAPRLIDELVPCRTTMVDEIVVGFEDAVGEPVVAHELPDVLDRVELWALRRQQNDGDIGRHEEARGQV